MHFAFTDEQEQLRRTVRSLLERHGGASIPPPEAPDPGYDTALWQQLAGRIGAHGLAVPEEHDGLGAGLLETNIVVEELGRRLVAIPFLASAVVGAQTLLAADDPAARARLLPGIASGESVATLAWAEPEHGWSTSACSTTAQPNGHGWLLDGRKAFVLDGAQADVVLVVAMTTRGLSLFELAPEAIPHCLVESAPMDITRRMAEFRLRQAPAFLVGTEGAAGAALERCLDVAAEGIQLHGGIGITWEHEAHLPLKRAHSGAELFGTPRQHRLRLEPLLELG